MDQGVALEESRKCGVADYRTGCGWFVRGNHNGLQFTHAKRKDADDEPVRRRHTDDENAPKQTNPINVKTAVK